MSLSSDLIRVEPKNTRGWPKSTRELEWAKAHVLEGMSLGRAALKAGYSSSVASAKTWKLKQRLAPFLAFLQELKTKSIVKDTGVTVQRIVDEMAPVAFSNLQDYFIATEDSHGRKIFVGKALDDLTREQAAAVRSFQAKLVQTKHGEVYDFRYELYDKPAALTKLGEHMGMFQSELILEFRHRLSGKKGLNLDGADPTTLEKLLSLLGELRARRESYMQDAVDAEQEGALLSHSQ
jgi:hypothetical protein